MLLRDSIRPLALLLLGPWLACAQTTPTMRITVTLVQVDAVVTDSSGRHVTDLGPGDFEILQDGEPQRISLFHFMPGPARVESLKDAAPLKTGNPKDAAPLGPPAPITAAQVKRAVALVVDDTALSFQDLVRTRDALKRYVEQQMQPGDLVAIVRTGGGVAILEQFTTDKRILLEAVNSLKWRFSGRQGLMPIAPRPEGDAAPRTTPQVLDYGYTVSALGALGTVEQVIEGMRRMPGRKSVVFLSDNLRVDMAVSSAIEHLTDLANRSAVSLYTVDPGGLRTRSRDPGDEPRITAAESEMERFPTFPGASGEFERQEGLSALASRTGGIFYANRNDIEGCIREAADDQLGYYLLGYSPKEGTFEVAGEKASPKFHKVTVRVNRRGLQVRWKSGFTGVPDRLEAPDGTLTLKSREQQLLDALSSPFAATGIGVRLTSIFTESLALGPVVSSMVLFDARDVTFVKQLDGFWHGSVDIVGLSYRGMKQPLMQGQKVQEIRLEESAYQDALKNGCVVMIGHKVQEPGTFLLRVVVRDAASRRVGSASQVVQVPDTRKGRFAISGISLRLATSDVMKQIGMEAPAGTDAWQSGGPAVRRYLPGQSLIYGYRIIHPKAAGPAKEMRVRSFVRVFRDGKLIYTSPGSTKSAKSDDGSKYGIGGGVLRLGGGLTPGEYLLQVVAWDELAGKKAPRVTQWVDFEVQKNVVAAN
jgi:VWFA-related protein